MIVVSGAPGRIGRHVVTGLLGRGETVRAISRNPDPGAAPVGVDAVASDLRDPHALERHLVGARAVFLLWPFLNADGAHELVEVLARHVPRIVYLSAEAASGRPDSPWATVERAIEGTAGEWTFLRPTGFAANTLMWAGQIRATGVVRWVYGRAERSLIDERDIAAVAVGALTEDGHIGARHVLSGPEALTQIDQVETIGAAIGRKLRWQEISRQDVQRQLAGVPDTALDTWASFTEKPEIVTSRVREITGQDAHSFGEWAHAHACEFQ